MNIRLATRKDLAQVLQLFESAKRWMINQGINQWDQDYPTSDVIEKDVNAKTLFVAFTEYQELVGAITLDNHQDPEYDDVNWKHKEIKSLTVHRLCIDPEKGRRGFGLALMQFAETHAKEQGCCSIRLDSYSLNPINLAFYKKLGYNHVGQVFFNRRPDPFYCFEKFLD